MGQVAHKLEAMSRNLDLTADNLSRAVPSIVGGGTADNRERISAAGPDAYPSVQLPAGAKREDR